jgi:Anti-sigma factor NepR
LIAGLFRKNRIGTGSTGMTQQWETTVANEEKPTEKARAVRARQRAIGRELRRMYDDVAQEPIPDDFMDLLRKIDEAEESKGGKKVS